MARKLENYLPPVMEDGINTDKAVALGSTLVVSGAATMSSTLAVTSTSAFTGVATFTAAPAFTAAPTGASPLRPITDSAATGATVVLTAAQCGGVFNNASTGGSPSWTLPAAANGLWYTFTCSNTTTGFTVTGGTIKAKASATGAAITGTTLTHTQGTAVIGDCITLVCDGTVWRNVSQAGTFAAS